MTHKETNDKKKLNRQEERFNVINIIESIIIL